MTSVDFCYSGAREAAKIWLASLGTERECEATKNYFAVLEEALMPVDELIAFAESERCAEIFGSRQADEIAHAYKLKADGAKYCTCPACKAAIAILEKKNEIFND